jgi:predicted RNA-binding Zn-ribbon protein involved in translation (DUF1610 family)
MNLLALESFMSRPTSGASELLCPKCQSESVWRSHREGPWEWFLHFFLYSSPYRCDDCGQRFYAGRGARPPLRPDSRDQHS